MSSVPDLIARIYPAEGCDESVAGFIRDSPACATQDQLSQQANAPASAQPPYVDVRLSSVPRSEGGFVFGSSPNCDVVLPITGVSARHFCLGFDHLRRLIVKDCDSRLGTQVTYNDEGDEARVDFQWVVGGHDFLENKEIIVRAALNSISFRVEVLSSGNLTAPKYIAKVDKFCRGKATAENLFAGLAIPDDTKLHSGALAIGTGAIYLPVAEIGSGAYGVVKKCWEVSKGQYCALKEPTKKALEQRDRDAWQRESDILNRLDHENIVKHLEFRDQPHPQLFLEYISGGPLGDITDLTDAEIISVLVQCLSALAYLHSRDPPVMHRDIKPDNILVARRDSGGIVVKYGDFGLSKESMAFKTFCGTPLFAAPEISSPYDPKADVFSLGSTIFQQYATLPDAYFQEGGVIRDREVAEVVEEHYNDNQDLISKFLLDNMVADHPADRRSAEMCLREAKQLAMAGGGGDPTEGGGDPTGAADPHAGSQQDTIRANPQKTAGDDSQRTIRADPHMTVGASWQKTIPDSQKTVPTGSQQGTVRPYPHKAVATGSQKTVGAGSRETIPDSFKTIAANPHSTTSAGSHKTAKAGSDKTVSAGSAAGTDQGGGSTISPAEHTGSAATVVPRQSDSIGTDAGAGAGKKRPAASPLPSPTPSLSAPAGRRKAKRRRGRRGSSAASSSLQLTTPQPQPPLIEPRPIEPPNASPSVTSAGPAEQNQSRKGKGVAPSDQGSVGAPGPRPGEDDPTA